MFELTRAESGMFRYFQLFKYLYIWCIQACSNLLFLFSRISMLICGLLSLEKVALISRACVWRLCVQIWLKCDSRGAGGEESMGKGMGILIQIGSIRFKGLLKSCWNSLKNPQCSPRYTPPWEPRILSIAVFYFFKTSSSSRNKWLTGHQTAACPAEQRPRWRGRGGTTGWW